MKNKRKPYDRRRHPFWRSIYVRTWNRRAEGCNIEVMRDASKRGIRFDKFLRFRYRAR